MINIYQLFPRIFGNKVQEHFINGSIASNGCGKFGDINAIALKALKELGITHIWLTGIIRHAKLTDYTAFGVPASHPSLVKGLAGSPYAITDYYDVDPDLADDVATRMSEFEQLIQRIHEQGLKIIIDFIPNHLAREYKSVAKPSGIYDFGENDNKNLAFHPDNNFYYISGRSFMPPKREDPIYSSETLYTEQPAKVTGNDCFHASPSLTDWFETVKLNYGVDYVNLSEQHFDPIPDTWHKMLHVLKYWTSKGLDGFRADMAEMVPVPFWSWAIRNLKSDYPETTMIAEIYQPALYNDFIAAGFDFLYDKVGLYNRFSDILLHSHAAESISICNNMPDKIVDKMVRFMENHDELRLASHHFLGDATIALPAVTLSAWMHSGAFMIYNGQESGENAEGVVGFSRDDGRTSIYDYCHMPKHQRWMNSGRFDGGKMLFDQKLLFEAYKKILRFRMNIPALREGSFYDLMWANPWFTEFDPRYVYAFLRYTEHQCLLIVTNFNRHESRKMRVNIPEDAIELTKIVAIENRKWVAVNLINSTEKIDFNPYDLQTIGIHLRVGPSQTAIYELVAIEFEDMVS